VGHARLGLGQRGLLAADELVGGRVGVDVAGGYPVGQFLKAGAAGQAAQPFPQLGDGDG
jgi:hypothetical protein